MKRFLIITGLFLIVAGAGAGGAIYYWGLDKIENVIGSDEPKAIAKRFWKGTLAGKPDVAAWYMKPQEGLTPSMASSSPDDEVILGSAIQQDGYYFIDTTLILNRSGGLRVVRLKTVLVPDAQGEWLVDFWSSQQTAFDVGLEDGLQRMTALLSNAALEFPYLIGSGGSEEEAKKAASEQIDHAFGEAKSKLLEIYQKQLEQLQKQSGLISQKATNPTQTTAVVSAE